MGFSFLSAGCIGLQDSKKLNWPIEGPLQPESEKRSDCLQSQKLAAASPGDLAHVEALQEEEGSVEQTGYAVSKGPNRMDPSIEALQIE